MPSNPKIKKEDMLQAALEIVIEGGYAALNIKAVAQKLGCSTAPISWQFGGMDGLRIQLIAFAEQYVRRRYKPAGENAVAQFEEIGVNTIEMAFEEPNLFRFLYMGDCIRLMSKGFQLTPEKDQAAYRKIADMLGISLEQAADFISMMVIYTQGIGTLIVSGIVQDTKENVCRMLHNTGVVYLRGLGVDGNVIQDIFKNAALEKDR